MKSYFSTNRVLAWAFTGILTTGLFFACKKDNNNNSSTTNPPTNPVGNNQTDNQVILAGSHETQVNAIYADVFASVSSASSGQGLDSNTARIAVGDKSLQASGSCPEVSMDTYSAGVWPRTVTINYGTSCSSNSFIGVRGGIVNATFSAPLWSGNATVTVTFSNYTVNGYPVSGTVTYSGISYHATADGGLTYTQKITDGKVKLNDTTYIVYNTTKTVKQIAGGKTPVNPGDDVFSVTGNGTISSANAAGTVAYSAALSTPVALVKAWNCQYISKGQLQIVIGTVTGTIDYGDGTCDNKATITVGDKVKDITL
ncbi:hypothetical protein [Chitinophaga sp. Cy-1792]|uniref:hypothetical protein n=1 Tax=Chitinophaga sp. Cy-1792 TaxID=2608339 RepID=UPI0014209E2B|nr:hypothetical protein [Chitinophaga sp. Cy-1792]NIG52861.1 hypothetical protein [Chitinophaga sp. Cy-1792]